MVAILHAGTAALGVSHVHQHQHQHHQHQHHHSHEERSNLNILDSLANLVSPPTVPIIRSTDNVVRDTIPALYDGPWRPQVHYSPPQNWMNDPNGLFKDNNGLYHLYYQYAPTLNPGPDKAWGHATSEDLYTWVNQPVAINYTPNDSIWSGSAVIDVNNTSGFFPHQNNGVVAIYTNMTSNLQTQAIAYSNDGGYTFTQYANDPVINIDLAQFRDPKVTWHAKSQRWVMAVSMAARSTIQFYTSKDLIHWQNVSNYTNPALNSVFECPQFLPIPFRAGGTPFAAANADVVKFDGDDLYILAISLGSGGPDGRSTVKYIPGTFDGITFTPVDNNIDRVMDFAEDAYATAFFYNLNPPFDALPVSMSWAVNLRYDVSEPTGATEGWLSAQSIPKTHYLANITAEGYDLISAPHNILPMLETKLSTEKSLTNGGIVIDYSTVESGAIYFDLELVTSSDSAANATLELDFVSSSTGEYISLTMALTNAGYASSRAASTTFTLSRANTAQFDSGAIPSFTQVVNRPYSTGALNSADDSRIANYSASGIIDRSICDVFLNGGVKAGTMIYFPSGPLDTIKLKINGLGNQGLVAFDAWGLKSGWANSGSAASRLARRVVDGEDGEARPEL